MSVGRSHTPFDELTDLVEGRLSAEQQDHVQHHVRECRQCTADVQWLHHTLSLMRDDNTEDAPTHVVARAVRMFRPMAEPARSVGQRLVAALRFDSGRTPLAFGTRAVQPAPRQLLYSVGAFDLDMRIQQQDERYVVSGQLLGSGGGGHVELRGPVATVGGELNDLQEFELPPVPSGPYTLLIEKADVSAEVPDIDVGS